MMQNRDQGATWTTAAKSPMAPAAQSMMSQASKQISQGGRGRKRKALYKHRKSRKKKISKYLAGNDIPKYNF